MKNTNKKFFILLILLNINCGNGQMSESDACYPIAEECNNIDDDCDNETDEAETGGPLRRQCSTDCGSGEEECVNGEWKFCTAPKPSDEICDGIDNNCLDGVDENCGCVHGTMRQCGIDIGECAFGTERCTWGHWSGVCEGEIKSTDEICDGKDNDCDNHVDEDCTCNPNQWQECGSDIGICAKGTQICLENGTWDTNCNGETRAQTEQCNSLDDDCNNDTDEYWLIDIFEPNDTCDKAYNLGEIDDGDDGTDITLQKNESNPDYSELATIMLPGDVDWYAFRAVEESAVCIPGYPECAFVLKATLDLWDGFFDGHYDEYEMCIIRGDCASQTDTSKVLCTRVSDYDSETGYYNLQMVWGGRCGYSDSTDVRIVVRTTDDSMRCGRYQLRIEYYFSGIVDCPN